MRTVEDLKEQLAAKSPKDLFTPDTIRVFEMQWHKQNIQIIADILEDHQKEIDILKKEVSELKGK